MVTTRTGRSSAAASTGLAVALSAARTKRKVDVRDVAVTRSKASKRMQCTEESSILTINPSEKRILRPNLHRGPPSCSDFGPCRKILYPNAFFCSNCAWWETEMRIGNMRAARRGKQFQCTAEHTSWLHPRQMVEVSYIRVDRQTHTTSIDQGRGGSDLETVFENECDGSDDDFDIVEDKQSSKECTQSCSESETEEYRLVIEEKMEEIGDLEERLRKAQKRLCHWRSKYYEMKKKLLVPNSNSMSDYICSHISKTGSLLLSKTRSRNVARSVVDALSTSTQCLLSQAICNAFYELAKHDIRQNLYSPQKVLEAMDMAGGQLSMEGIEILRTLETKNKKYYRGSLLPCSADIQRCAAKVEAYAKTKCPYEHGYMEGGGEYIRFRPADVVNYAITSFKLTEAAKQRSVSLSQSFDGANLTKKLGHTTYGIKVTDRQAISPFTNRPIFAEDPKQSALQSRNNNLPIMIVMRNETKEVVDGFHETMKEVSGYGTDASVLSPGYQPIKMAFNSDLSAGWKVRGIGGAAKRETRPCHCCAITSDDLAVPNGKLCSKYCDHLHVDKVGWCCYHQNFLSEEYTNTLEAELSETASIIHNLLPELDVLKKQSVLHVHEDPRYSNTINRKDPLSIHFDVEGAHVSRETRHAYSQRVGKDLELRHLSITGNLVERQDRLRNSMEQEFKHGQLRDAIEHGRKSEAHALVKLHETVPCILHMENRSGLKILTMLLTEGLHNALKGRTYSNVAAEGNRMRQFFVDIERACNKQVWGNDNNPTQWVCPRDENKKEIGTICLDNNKTRKVIDNIELLLPYCVQDPMDDEQSGRMAVWKRCVPHYRDAILTVRSRVDLSPESVFSFQNSADLFFQDWVALHGREGVTNYIHMIGSGHICEYLIYWGNLYSHSQQGWEAFNSLLKTYYFRRTLRGGSGGGKHNQGKKSRIVPIARWLSRRMMWMCGVPYTDMLEGGAQQTTITEELEEDFAVGPSLDSTDNSM